MALGWNHNNHYHSVLLEALPQSCGRALDIGCGLGEFARKVASRAEVVDAIDQSDEMIQRAKELSPDLTNLTFINADFMHYPLEPSTYDFISGLAVLHHLPFVEGVERMKLALRSHGVLAILGLYKERVLDLPQSLLAVVVNQIYLRVKDSNELSGEIPAPIADSTMTLPQIRNAVSWLLPGAKIRKHLLWRYSVIWQKP